MKILPRGKSILRLWFPDLDSLNAYWKQHKALHLTKEYSIDIKSMEYEGQKGFEFKLT